MHSKAADVKAPFLDASSGANVVDSALFSLTNTSKNNALPRGWIGQFIRIRPVGANAWFYLTKAKIAAGSSATIAASPAPSDPGTQAATQGEYVPNGELFHCWVPYCADDENIFLVRIGDAAGQGLYVTKSSGTPGNNLESGK